MYLRTNNICSDTSAAIFPQIQLRGLYSRRLVIAVFNSIAGEHKSQASGCRGDKIQYGGTQYWWTHSMSPSWRLEFWGGCYIFGKFVHH